jgi:hypothetical protein
LLSAACAKPGSALADAAAAINLQNSRRLNTPPAANLARDAAHSATEPRPGAFFGRSNHRRKFLDRLSETICLEAESAIRTKSD